VKQLVQDPGFAVAVIAPCAAVLVLLECLYVIPGRFSRLVVLRRVVWVLAVLLVALFAAVVIARFIKLRVQ
jgi:hypothetical protein